MQPEPRQPLARFLALNRTVSVVLVSVLLFGLGEELWRSFMPALLRSQDKEAARAAAAAGAISAATLWAVGLYACLLNLFEAFCYIGGGQLTAQLGDRGSLFLFGLLTIGGYILFLAFAHVQALTIIAALLILGWEPLSVPVTFTTVGSTVATERQGMAFAVQSIQKRLPKIIGPALAGFVLDYVTRVEADASQATQLGMRMLVAAALGLGVASLAVQWRWMPRRPAPPPGPPGSPGPPARDIVRSFPPVLRRLLLAECFTRWCDWLVREFVLLYIVFVHGASWTQVGLLFSLQNVTALLTYLPVGRLTQSAGLRPFVGVTFIFFALFPLVLALVPNADWLWLAFIVYGLREIGEPARKALITSNMPEEVRARGVGLYWGLRSFVLCTASLAGAGLWLWASPQALLLTAFGLGCVGAAIYYLLANRAS